jgi:hypothetical protein
LPVCLPGLLAFEQLWQIDDLLQVSLPIPQHDLAGFQQALRFPFDDDARAP